MSSTSTGGSTVASPRPGRSKGRAAAFAALTAGIVVAALWRPTDTGLPLCFFRFSTGLSCPGCGMTRSLTAVGRGELEVAVRYHAFGPLIAVGLGALWAAIGIGLATGRNLLPEMNSRRISLFLVVFIGAFLAYWLIRVLTGTAP